MGQAQFAAQTVLQHAPEAFDAAFGLGRLRSDEGGTKIRERATELRGLPLTRKFFLESPAVIVADEDTAAIAVEGGGNAEAAEQALQQVRIAFGGFRREELRGEDFAGSVVRISSGPDAERPV
jgi:hypothetical protein